MEAALLAKLVAEGAAVAYEIYQTQRMTDPAQRQAAIEIAAKAIEARFDVIEQELDAAIAQKEAEEAAAHEKAKKKKDAKAAKEADAKRQADEADAADGNGDRKSSGK